MRTIIVLIAVALAPLLTSCQSSGSSASLSQSNFREPRPQETDATTPSPFHPVRPLVSARYTPPDRYYGFGGGYRPVRTASTGGSADDLNFLYDSDRCCWRRRHCSSSYLTCGSSYGSYRGSYARNYCSPGRGGGYYVPGCRW